MKILFVSTIGSAWGGSEELWSQAAVRLVKKGYAIVASVGYFGQVHHKIAKLEQGGVKVKYRRNKLIDAFCKGLDAFELAASRSYIKNSYERHILEEKPDAVVFSQATCFGAYELMLFCKRREIPYYSISQLNTEYGWPSDANYISIAEAFKAANVAFFVSKGNLDLFQLQIAEKLPNAVVIPNPFNMAAIPELSWPEQDVFNIAHVARLDFTHKGTDILLKCFAEAQWKNRNFRLNIYGKGNEALAKKLAAYCGTFNTSFMGHASDVAAVWQENHLLVLTSRYEGMPLSLIEAMYCGRTAVVTDVAGHAELVEDGEYGYLAEAATEKHFSHALERAWAERNNWKAMGERARSRIVNLYSDDPVNVFVEKLLATF